MADVPETERQFVDYACRDHIVTIAMNRPEKLNAVVRQLMAAFRRLAVSAGAASGEHRGR